MLEIRWHGRGGQGVKTAALLLGEALLSTGKYIQAFPEYGPERSGAPVVAFNRISEEEIWEHCAISAPDVVVILDDTLLTNQLVEGLKEGGWLLINTSLSPERIKEKLDLTTSSYKLATLDATSIAQQILKINLPNTPMLGALFRITQILSLEEAKRAILSRLNKKFKSKPIIIENNLVALEEGYKKVKF
jgi:pyruvate ferredoxin oxidoreductase gamma subunit